ncbi:hypothetical protein ACFXKY_30870 [Streptomyces canus]
MDHAEARPRLGANIKIEIVKESKDGSTILLKLGPVAKYAL